jgi:hypothetical protein
MRVELHHGDCVQVLRAIPEGSIAAIVCDPPYGIGFMGSEWDDFGRIKQYQRKVRAEEDLRQHAAALYEEFNVSWLTECFRVLRPGGICRAFSATRMYHRVASAMELTGFREINLVAWGYGSGFPKNLDISKAIDKRRDDREQVLEVTGWIRGARDAAGLKNADIDGAFGFAGMSSHWTSKTSQPTVPTLEQWPLLLKTLGDPEVPSHITQLVEDLNQRKGQPGEAWDERKVVAEVDRREGSSFLFQNMLSGSYAITTAATEEAMLYTGWGTALKPAWEPVVVGVKA